MILRLHPGGRGFESLTAHSSTLRYEVQAQNPIGHGGIFIYYQYVLNLYQGQPHPEPFA